MTKQTKNLTDKFNIAKDALYIIATQASIWEPVSNLKSGISKIGTLRDVARKALAEIDEIDETNIKKKKKKHLAI